MDNQHHAAVTDVDSLSAGALLRRHRELKKVSLEEAAEATKIGRNYLRALEEDCPQDLPSPAYLKGFLRIYAVYLGLEAEKLIQLATVSNGTSPAEPAAIPQAIPRPDGFSWQRLFLPSLLLTALILSAIVLSPSTPHHARPSAPLQAPQQAQQPVVDSTAVQPALSSAVVRPVSEQAITGSEALPENQIAAPKPAEGFVVRMKVTRNSTLSVTIDDAASQRYELTSGDLIEWKAARTIALDVSDTTGVELEMNGTPLKLAATTERPTFIVLDVNGIKQ